MNITAKYTAPPPGTVTLTLDEPLAQKLRALLGQCTSETFSKVYDALSVALPVDGHLELELGSQPGFNTGKPVISLGANYGAVFRPKP